MKRSGATKDQLFDAAADLFREYGYAETSHADISAEADIGRTTFYEHFASKEDLLVQLVQRDLPVLIDEILADIKPGSRPTSGCGNSRFGSSNSWAPTTSA